MLIQLVGSTLAKLERLFPLDPVHKGFLRVFVLALAVRLLFLAVWVNLVPITWDGAEMRNVAVNLYYGRGFSSPLTLGSQPTAWFAPLVPILWAAIMHVTAGDPDRTYLTIILLQTIPSALSCALYWLIARCVTFRMSPAPVHIAAAMAAVSCLWPLSLLYLTVTWYYVWQELGFATLFWWSIRWCDDPCIRHGLILGLVAGAVLLVNPTPLPIFVFVLVAPLVVRRAHPLAVGGAMAASLAAAVFVVSPWVIRNTLVFERFIPIRGTFGIELLQGNNPAGSIEQGVNSVHPYIQPSERARYMALGEAEYSRWAFQTALEYMREHPMRTAVRVAQRIYVYWCTDLFDQWSWFPTKKWWRSRKQMLMHLTQASCALVPLTVVLFGLATGRLRGLPYWFLFIGVFLLLPLPYYFTQVNPTKFRDPLPYLVMLAIIVLLRFTSSGGAPWRRTVDRSYLRADSQQIP